MTLALLALAGCEKGQQAENAASAICGEWKNASAETETSIYLCFSKDGSFELYQNLKGTGYEVFRGRWFLKDNTLSGEYNDGEEWAYSYTVMQYDKVLTLTTVGEEENVFEFVSTEIPSVIRETAEIIVKASY